MNVKITKNIEEANMITHTGSFHPDDVSVDELYEFLLEDMED